MDTPIKKTADMKAYRAAWKAANPDKVKAQHARHNRKRKTAKWKAAHTRQVNRLRKWKTEYQRRKRAEAAGKAFASTTPEQQAFLELRRLMRDQSARCIARHEAKKKAAQ